MDKTSRFLFETVSPSAPVGIGGYLINPVSGALETTVPGSPFLITGGLPVGIVADLTGHFIYAPSLEASELSGFTINQVSGSLRALTQAPLQLPFGPNSIVVTVPGAPSTAPLTSLAIEPSNLTVDGMTTQTAQFTAAGTLNDGTHSYLTASATWGSSNPSVATISNTPGLQGLATIIGIGTTQITATLGLVSTAATLSVSPPTLVSIAVTPLNPSVRTGTAIQFIATGSYSDGSVENISSSVIWQSSSTAVARVGPMGLAYAKAAGQSTISASSGMVTNSTSLTVILGGS